MGKCTIDHTQEDVRQKLKEQQAFLPPALHDLVSGFLRQPRGQEVLNEVFHLLKKYDLSTDAEQERRNEELKKWVK